VRKDADQQVAAGVVVKGHVLGRLTRVTAAHGRGERVAMQQAVALRLPHAVAQHLGVVFVDGTGFRVVERNGREGEHGTPPIGKGCVVVPLLLQASPQQAQLVPGGAVLARLPVVASVRETVDGKAELGAVERESFEQEAKLLKAGDGGLVARRLLQQLVEAFKQQARRDSGIEKGVFCVMAR
jgi:hypothetical protein